MGVGRAVGIVGTGMSVPERRLTNFDLAQMVDTSDEWIRTRTGIVERRIVRPDQTTSDLATAAAEQALSRADLSPSQVDFVLVATVTPDMIFPSTASLVQHRLGARRAGAADVGVACSGFIYALAMGAQFIATGLYETVLVIGAECMSHLVDWTDRSTCVLFGDGAGAVVLQPVPPGYGLLGIDLGSDGSSADHLKVVDDYPANPQAAKFGRHPYIRMNGNEVFKFAVRIQGEACERVLHRCHLRPAEVDWFIPHQANIRIIDAAAKRLGLPPEKVFVNVHRYGNTSAASIPIALAEADEQGLLRRGDNVLMVGFGAGLTWGAALVRWSQGKEGTGKAYG